MGLFNRIRTWKYTLISDIFGTLELEHNPIGWDSSENTLARSKKYEGIFNNYSLSALEFTGTAKDFIIQAHDLQGVFMNMSIKVDRRNQFTKLYDNVYTGILDAKTYDETQKNGDCISIKIGESSLNESLLAREDNVINYDDEFGVDGQALSIINPKYQQCTVQGMEITTTANGLAEASDSLKGAGYLKSYMIQKVVLESNNENIKNPVNIGLEDILKASNGGWIYETFNRTSKFRFIMTGNAGTAVDAGMTLVLAFADKIIYDTDDNGNPVDDDGDVIVDPDWIENLDEKELVFVPKNSIPFSTPTIIDIDETISVGLDKAILLYWKSDISNTIVLSENIIKIEISELPITKTINTILTFDLMRRIVESITGQDAFQSDLLQNNEEFNKLLNFNGYMARGYDTDVSNYAISLSDIFDSYKILVNGGLGINNGIVSFESIDNFYQDEIVLTIDNVVNKSWSRKFDESLFISGLESGYKGTSNEESSGLEEYNNLNKYSTPITNTKSKLALTPKIRLGGYEITYAIDTPVEESESTDTKYDSKNFALDTKKPGSVYIQKGRDDFESVTGIDQITSPMNLNFTPAQLALRNSDRFSIGLDKKPNSKIKFTKSDIATDLETKKASQNFSVKENADIDYFKLNKPRFSGFIIKFEWTLSFNEFATLVAGKYKRIKVFDPFRKLYRFAWIRKTVQTSTTKEANFELIEQYNGIDPDVVKIMSHHTGKVVITNKDEKILVNG